MGKVFYMGIGVQHIRAHAEPGHSGYLESQYTVTLNFAVKGTSLPQILT